MTLSSYLNQPGAKSLTELSREVGVSKGRLSQLRDEVELPPELAMRLEDATGGALSATMLSSIVAKARAGASA